MGYTLDPAYCAPLAAALFGPRAQKAFLAVSSSQPSSKLLRVPLLDTTTLPQGNLLG